MRPIVLGLIACCVACGANTDDQKVIAERRNSFNLAIASHDTSEMVKSWADDIVVVTSRNARFVGKDQYAKGLSGDFATKPDVVYIRTPETIEIFSAWEMAAESGRWIGSWTNGDEKIEVRGTYYAKWKKVNAQWMISAEIYTPLKCSGDSYCNKQ